MKSSANNKSTENSDKTKPKKIDNSKKVFAVDLFCGVGGLTNGLEAAGINVLVGYDFDSSVEFAYSKNNKAEFKLQDITKLKSQEIKKLFQDHGATYTLVAGCAPCQPFSSYQKDKSAAARKEHYGYPAFESFIRIVQEVKPTFVTMENVQGIIKDDNFDLFVNDLKRFGYFVKHQVVNIAHYGAPQNRRRLILLASKLGPIEVPKKVENKILTVKEAIGHLPEIKSGEVYAKDPLHKASRLSEINLERIKSSVPGGTWRSWKPELLPKCYLKPSGQSYSSVYGRLRPNSPAGTLTTQFTRYGTGRYGHYEQDRALSLREGAIIQTFPENYQFNIEELGSTTVAKHIGNAVPPIAGKIIGETMIGKLNESNN